jgi:hypothetical protein
LRLNAAAGPSPRDHRQPLCLLVPCSCHNCSMLMPTSRAENAGSIPIARSIARSKQGTLSLPCVRTVAIAFSFVTACLQSAASSVVRRRSTVEGLSPTTPATYARPVTPLAEGILS